MVGGSTAFCVAQTLGCKFILQMINYDKYKEYTYVLLQHRLTVPCFPYVNRRLGPNKPMRPKTDFNLRSLRLGAHRLIGSVKWIISRGYRRKDLFIKGVGPTTTNGQASSNHHQCRPRFKVSWKRVITVSIMRNIGDNQRVLNKITYSKFTDLSQKLFKWR